MTASSNPLEVEAETLFGSAREALTNTLQHFAVAIATGDSYAAQGELANITEDLRAILIVSNLAGRLRVHQRVDAFKHSHEGAREVSVSFAKGIRVGTKASEVSGTLPKVPFKEAITSLLEREPRLVDDYKTLAHLYRRENVFALARSTDITVTRNVQAILQRFLETGADRLTTHDAIKMVGGFTDNYTDTVFRNAVNTSYSDGRIAKLQDPVIRSIIPALRFRAVGGKHGDGDTRKNHAAAHDMIASPEWFEVSGFKPPLGHKCRCRLDFVDRLQAQKAGVLTATGKVRDPRVPRGAYRDPGF